MFDKFETFETHIRSFEIKYSIAICIKRFNCYTLIVLIEFKSYVHVARSLIPQ